MSNVEDRGPEKPKFGATCNGCGVCCMVQLCPLATVHLPPQATAPCPMLHFHDGRFWCGLFEATEADWQFVIGALIGVEMGCESTMPTGETAAVRTMASAPAKSPE